jgi:hypothetical protein
VEFGKPTSSKTKCKPGNISAVWIVPAHQAVSNAQLGRAAPETMLVENRGLLSSHDKAKKLQITRSETLINGVKQGYRSSSFTSRKLQPSHEPKCGTYFTMSFDCSPQLTRAMEMLTEHLLLLVAVVMRKLVKKIADGKMPRSLDTWGFANFGANI